MELFVRQGSIVRDIWGRSDVILFIFGGAAAEFALNKAVDWLYFTGRLPADPLERLFSTVTYARQIVFSPTEQAHRAIDSMHNIHSSVESKRGSAIPDWAYRDVLFMLIHYSITAYEALVRKLDDKEKEEVFFVFRNVGLRMELTGLPGHYQAWKVTQAEHLENDLQKSKYTIDLYQQYRKHLGWLRFQILREAQILIVPEKVRLLLGFRSFSLLTLVLPFYKLSRWLRIDWYVRSLLLPKKYKLQIRGLDVGSMGSISN